jgi:hypothetical protein
MNSSTISAKRRAVYTGLQPFLRDNELMEAMILWENRYADEPKFSLRYFASDLSKHIQRPHDANRLYINLVSTQSKPVNELLPDPLEEINAYRKRRDINTLLGEPAASAASHYAVPEIEAFKVLVNKWLGLETSAAAIDINRFVMLNLDRLDIDPSLKVQISRWLADDRKDIKVNNLQIKDLRKIINLFYIGFCEYIGPPRADALLAEAITRLKSNGGATYREIFAKLL